MRREEKKMRHLLTRNFMAVIKASKGQPLQFLTPSRDSVKIRPELCGFGVFEQIHAYGKALVQSV